MKKMFVKVLPLLLVTVVFAVLVGCKNNADGGDSGNGGSSDINQALVGTWTTSTNSFGFPTKMILKANGTGEFTFTQNSENKTWPGTWTATNNTITLTVDSSTHELSYSISGNTATVTLNNNSATYTKQ